MGRNDSTIQLSFSTDCITESDANILIGFIRSAVSTLNMRSVTINGTPAYTEGVFGVTRVEPVEKMGKDDYGKFGERENK